MAALKDQWQEARQVRQAAVVQRRQQVQSDLSNWQTHRLATAAELRQSLDQMYAALQDDTAHWLATIRGARLAQAPLLHQSLQDYVQQIQLTTAEQLEALTSARLSMAESLRQQLVADHQELEIAVSDLRLNIIQDLQQIQRQVQALRQETAVMRTHHQQQQALMRSQLFPKLDAYVADLQDEVAATLAAIAADRQIAAQIAQEQRLQDRQALTAEVDQMFTELSQFRQSLKTFHHNLKATVWGESQAVPNSVAAVPKAVAQSTVATKSAMPKRAQTPAPAGTSLPKSSKPAAKAAPKAVAKPAAKPAAISAPRSRRRVAAGASTPPAGATLTLEPPPVAEPVPAPVAEPASLVPSPESVATVDFEPASADNLEESIYNYLHATHGARLTEIETQLGINRFQAVDALRSLIQKELIVQQDRIYQVHEEALL